MLPATPTKTPLTRSEQHRRSETEAINVVCAADDAYAMPLAVTLQSLFEHLAEGQFVNLYVFDGGISEQNWIGIKETLAGVPVAVNVINPDQSLFSDLTISHHISHTAYFRLMTAELLPASVNKAIYLDSDLLIRDDITQLWNLPIENQYCLATIDIACPNIDAKLGNSNFRMSSPYMASYRPIRNYKDLNIDGRGEYFNSGVMVINVDRWRKENVADQLLRCLHENRKHIWCWDQYALNAVFAGEWSCFSPRWNQGAHTFEYPSARHSPIQPGHWLEMKNNPAIVHFTTEFKPWQHDSDHPRGELFFEGLRDTPWSDWRPKPPNKTVKSWINHRVVNVMKRTTISSRKIASIWA